MKSAALCGLTTILALSFSVPSFAGKPDPRKHGWFQSYSAGREESQKTGKPMMVVFRCEP